VEDAGFELQQGQEIFFCPKLPVRLWGSPSPFNGYHGLSTGKTLPGREGDHSPRSSAEVKTECSFAGTRLMFLHGTYKDNYLSVHSVPLIVLPSVGKYDLFFAKTERVAFFFIS